MSQWSRGFWKLAGMAAVALCIALVAVAALFVGIALTETRP